MINIKININKNKKSSISVGSLTATDWLNNIKQNKIIKNGKEKNIISSQKLLSSLNSKEYIYKLSKSKGYKPKEKYLKKKWFELKEYEVKDDKGNTRKTTYTLYITRKGQRKLLGIVLNLIKEKTTEATKIRKRTSLTHGKR